jgi:hypothetical protein
MTGDKELLAKLTKLAGDKGIRKQARVATLDYAEDQVEYMKEDTPVKTGALRDSEHAKVAVSPKKEDIRIALIAGGATAPYAARVNATHKTKGQFMEKRIAAMSGTAAVEIAKGIDLERAAEGMA